jgi:hypothetical protein
MYFLTVIFSVLFASSYETINNVPFCNMLKSREVKIDLRVKTFSDVILLYELLVVNKMIL